MELVNRGRGGGGLRQFQTNEAIPVSSGNYFVTTTTTTIVEGKQLALHFSINADPVTGPSC